MNKAEKLQSSANEEMEDWPRLSNGYPDSKQISSIWDYMAALTPAQWDQNLPRDLKVDCYLYRINPPVPWCTVEGANQYVTKITEAVDEDWIRKNFGGRTWKIRLVHGKGKARGDLYTEVIQIASPPMDLDTIAIERMKNSPGERKGGNPVGAVTPAAATAGPEVTGAAPAGMFQALEKMQDRFFTELREARQGINPMKEAEKIVEAQREMLKAPVAAPQSDFTLKGLMDLLREERKATFDMFQRMQPAAATSDLKSQFGFVREVLGFLRENEFGTGGASPDNGGTTIVQVAKTVMEGLPKVAGAVGEAMKEAGAQRARMSNPAQPAPVQYPGAAQNGPNELWSWRKQWLAKLVVTHLPAEDEDYAQEGFNAADQARAFDLDAAIWLRDHIALGEQRPSDPDTDPIFLPVVASKHITQFAMDYVQYFTDGPPEAAADEPPQTPPNV